MTTAFRFCGPTADCGELSGVLAGLRIDSARLPYRSTRESYADGFPRASSAWERRGRISRATMATERPGCQLRLAGAILRGLERARQAFRWLTIESKSS